MRKSTRHGFVTYAISEPRSGSIATMDRLSSDVSDVVCRVGRDDRYVGVQCWYVRPGDRWSIRFMQPGDPRLNGSVVYRGSGNAIGMYAAKEWFDAPGECVPVDLFFPSEGEDTDFGERSADVEATRRERIDSSSSSSSKRPDRAIEIGNNVFVESKDGKTMRLVGTNVRPTVIREYESRRLRCGFDDLLAGRRTEWTDGRSFTIGTDAVRTWFHDRRQTATESASFSTTSVSTTVSGGFRYPCEAWW